MLKSKARKSQKLIILQAKREMEKNKKSNLMDFSIAVKLKKRKNLKERKKRKRRQKKKRNSREAHESEMMFRLRSVTWAMDAGPITISLQKFKLDNIDPQKL